MVKYKQYFQEMLTQNKELFDSFGKIHSRYVLDPKIHQEEFNKKGEEVLDVIRKYENRLCRQTEGSVWGKFSTTLAEKFQAEVKSYFPKIDCVGLTTEEAFNIKKINLD